MAEDAQVKVGVDASAVERAAAAIKTSFLQVGDTLANSIGSAAKSVATSLADVALAAGRVNFGAQREQVKAFESSTAHMAVAMGRDLETVRAGFEQTGREIARRPGEVEAWTDQVGRLTYSFDSAGKAVKGLSALAATTGRSIEDYRGLAVELGSVGKVTGDTTHALGVMAAQAEKFKTVGGIAAFADQIEGLSGAISHFAVKGESDLLRITAASAALTKGLDPQAAQRVSQGAFGALASDPIGWSRFLGRDITNEQGKVDRPEQVLQQITEKIKRTYGKDAERMLMLQFGAETGKALSHADWKAAAEAQGLSPSTGLQEKQRQLLDTDAGKREKAQADLDASSRNLMGSSTLLGKAADALQRFAASNPISATLVSTALGSGAASAFGGLAKLLAPAGGGAGSAALGFARAIPVVGAAVGGFAAGGVAGEFLSDVYDENVNKPRERQELAAMDAQTAAMKTLRDRKRAERATMGFAQAAGLIEAPFAPASVYGGGQPAPAAIDKQAIETAVEKGASKAKITIVNMTGGPIAVADDASRSPAAGSQSGG